MTAADGPAGAPAGGDRRFDRPILLISTPRAGSTLMFETLIQAPGVFSVGDESHRRIERIPGLAPNQRDWDSNRLTADDATASTVAALGDAFYADARDRDGAAPTGPIRLLEKTPKNALRIPFFDAAWPDARYVYLYRDPRATMASMIEAWMSGGFRTYPRLPGWQGPPWSLLLVPGWRDLVGLPVPQVVAHQWARTTRTIIEDLEAMPGDRVEAVDYRDFIAAPQSVMAGLADRLELGWDRTLGDALPLSRTTVSRPAADKWTAIRTVIEDLLPIVRDADEQARAFLAARRF